MGSRARCTPGASPQTSAPFSPFLPRSASFSQATRSSFFMRSDTAVQKLSQGNGHCVNGVGAQLHGFYSLPKPSRHNSEFRDSAYDLPRAFGSYSHPKSSLTSSETDNEDVYTYKTPSNALCKEFGELSTDSYDVPATPLSVYQIPRTFTLDKNHNALAVAASDSPAAPPPRPPKPGQTEPRWGSPPQRPQPGESLGLAPMAATIPRRNTLPAVENSRLHRGEFGAWEQRGGGISSQKPWAGRSNWVVLDTGGMFAKANVGLNTKKLFCSEDPALLLFCNGLTAFIMRPQGPAPPRGSAGSWLCCALKQNPKLAFQCSPSPGLAISTLLLV